jgi:hypothetical protein
MSLLFNQDPGEEQLKPPASTRSLLHQSSWELLPHLVQGSGPGMPDSTQSAHRPLDVRLGGAWAIPLYFMQSYSSANLRLDVLSRVLLVSLSLRPFHSLDFSVITAGSETRFKFLLPPLWPIGVVQSLLSLILDLPLL